MRALLTGLTALFLAATVEAQPLGGCPGAGGIEPVISAATPPQIGMRSWSVDLSQAAAPGFAWLCIGARTDQWNGVPLPFDAGGGCLLRLGILWWIAVPVSGNGPGTGTASYPVPLPPEPSLRGAMVHAQWLVADPASGSPFGLTVTALWSTTIV
jgi:hypothetical protein